MGKEALPLDLVIEILSRIPTKSLLRFKSVSKTWLKLLTTDHHFINLHLHRSNKTETRNTTGFLIWNPSHCEKVADFKYVDNGVVMHNPRALNLPFEKSPNDRLYGITNGLLYLTRKDTASPLYLWNPFTGDHIAITCPPTSSVRVPVSFGFGYHRDTNQYKVIRIVSTPTVKVDHSSCSAKVDLYTLGTESWRRLENIPYQFRSFNVTHISGNLIWLVYRYVKLPPASNIILSFSIKDEIFKEIERPKQLSFTKPFFVSIGELDKLLCMYYGVQHDFCEVWVMKEYGVPSSWTKKFKIDQSIVDPSLLDSSAILCATGDGYILKGEGCFGNGPKSFMFYNQTTNSVKKIGYFCPSYIDGYSYNGSLVSPTFINQSCNEK